MFHVKHLDINRVTKHRKILRKSFITKNLPLFFGMGHLFLIRFGRCTIFLHIVFRGRNDGCLTPNGQAPFIVDVYPASDVFPFLDLFADLDFDRDFRPYGHGAQKTAGNRRGNTTVAREIPPKHLGNDAQKQDAVYDRPLELRRGCVFRVHMDRIVVPGQVRERLHIFYRQKARG